MIRTKTQATCDAYKSRAKNIIKKYKKDNENNPMEFIQWLRYYVSTITSRSWSTVRASLIYSLEEETEVHLDGYENSTIVYNIMNLKNLVFKDKKKSTSTSTKKYKYLPQLKYSQLQEELKNGTSKYDKILFHWLEAIKGTGIRPSEWGTIEIMENTSSKNTEFLIRVVNGKQTNGRAHGEHRTIHLQPEENLLYSIMHTWKHTREIYSRVGEDGYNSFYKACKDRLLYINSRIGCYGVKKRITLYSARHQFSADMLGAGKSKTERAALMGHGSTSTAEINYAKKSYARPYSGIINPSKEDINNVIEWNKGKKHKKSFNQFMSSKPRISAGVSNEQ